MSVCERWSFRGAFAMQMRGSAPNERLMVANVVRTLRGNGRLLVLTILHCSFAVWRIR